MPWPIVGNVLFIWNAFMSTQRQTITVIKWGSSSWWFGVSFGLLCAVPWLICPCPSCVLLLTPLCTFWTPVQVKFLFSISSLPAGLCCFWCLSHGNVGLEVCHLSAAGSTPDDPCGPLPAQNILGFWQGLSQAWNWRADFELHDPGNRLWKKRMTKSFQRLLSFLQKVLSLFWPCLFCCGKCSNYGNFGPYSY